MCIEHRIKNNKAVQQRVLESASSCAVPVNVLANGNVRSYVTDEEIAEAQAVVEYHMDQALRAMFIDVDNDHNTQDTGRRWAKMMFQESFSGRFKDAPKVTTFRNEQSVDELYLVGPIQLRSTCAHHLVPITGEVYVGVLPRADSELIGLSKFHRIVDFIASRPQIQEEMTMQIANKLEELIKPEGLAVVVNAKHLCCGHRGVKDPNSAMTTSVMRGNLRSNAALRNEFLTLSGIHSR